MTLIAIPNSPNSGKTTVLKQLIVFLAGINGANVKMIYCEPDLQQIAKRNCQKYPTLDNKWIINDLMNTKDSQGRQLDLSVVIGNIPNGNGKNLKIGVCTHGDDYSMLQRFICDGNSTILNNDFIKCDVVFSACRRSRSKNPNLKSNTPYGLLQKICADLGNNVVFHNVH